MALSMLLYLVRFRGLISSWSHDFISLAIYAIVVI